MENGYLQVAGMLPAELCEPLLLLSETVQSSVTEIRLRAGQPLTVMEHCKVGFVGKNGRLWNIPKKECVKTDKRLLEQAFLSLCGWAVHTRQRELNLGYIGLAGGHRAGIGATAIVQEGVVTGQREVHSINIRIGRQVFGAADRLLEQWGMEGGIVLAGAPASGKTTILRDLARQLGGACGGYRKVTVVDETGELAGNMQNDLGMTTDLLLGYPKAWGLTAAVRYLSPQVMLCDEIATAQEVDGVIAAANSGVMMVTSMHGASREELCRKESFCRMRQAGVFRYVAVLQGGNTPGRVADLWDLWKEAQVCC